MYQPYVTKLPLAQFAQYIGINPLHTWGVQIPEIEGNPGICNQAIFSYGWQTSDAVSREEITQCIAQAEADIETYLGYRLLPSWEEEEWRAMPRPYHREQVYLSPYDVRGFQQGVETRWKKVLSGGRRGQTLIEAGAAITYDSALASTPAYHERATVTVAVADGVAACEVACYYPGKAGDEHHRIRPIQVSITGNTATITFRRELAVKEEFFEAIASGGNYLRPVQGTVDANFLDEVDVYRVYNDGETQASLLWFPPTCGSCGGSGCSACQLASQTGCLTIRDPDLGFVAPVPATWDAATRSFHSAERALGRQPDAVNLYYYAGMVDRSRACPLNDLSEDWARTVAYLAAARLERPICKCSSVSVTRWQRDLAFSGGTGSFRMSDEALGNPLGTLAGEVFAWRRITRPGASLAALSA